MIALLDKLVLQSEVTSFERAYLERVNRVALWLLIAHLPVFTLIAKLRGERALATAIITAAVLIGPITAQRVVENPRTRSIVHGVAGVFMGGLLVHLGQGQVQIEMHFYFFCLIALCAVFANPMVVVAVSVTIALHHVVLWLALPRSLFNYGAAWWVLAIHAVFVVFESIAIGVIARGFHESMISLERTVQERTAALAGRNSDMRLLLDQVEQGFVTIDRSGRITAEWSAAIDRWFGSPVVGTSWFEFLTSLSPRVGTSSSAAWGEVESDVLPLELALDQLPSRIVYDASTYAISYRPIGATERAERFLVVVSDITASIAKGQAEDQRHDTMAIVDRALIDSAGIRGFLEEGSTILAALADPSTGVSEGKRLLHTLKGNAALYGLTGLATECETLECWIGEMDTLPSIDALRLVQRLWAAVVEMGDRMLGEEGRIDLDEVALARLEDAIERGAYTKRLLELAGELRLEPTSRRFELFADQARQIAVRLGKPGLVVVVESHGLRLDARLWAAFWGSFVHAIRNALDHGIERPGLRLAAGKTEHGTITLRTRITTTSLVIEIEDDGRGVDWDAVRLHAERAGLPHRTMEELQAALFCDGLSTAAAGSTLSGRGVGMSALLDATRALEGTIHVSSRTGRGTTVAMFFPLASIHAATTAQETPCRTPSSSSMTLRQSASK